MNPTTARQIALDNALVPPRARLKISECNRRIEFSKPQREATYQVTLDSLKLSPCYPAFLITARVQEIYMHQFWNTVTKVKESSSYQFKLDNKKFRVNAEGMYHCKNVDFVKLLWEDFAFQIENHFSKESMPYSRFTKIIINHFISQNKSISLRNKINLHTARDDSLLGTLKYVSKTEEHQVYRALIPKEMLNEDILNSTTYKTYYAYVNGAKEPKKARKFKKPASPKQKTVLVSPKEPTKKPGKAKKDVTSTKKTTTKPKPTKKKAPVKADGGKGLNVLSEVALFKASQLKEVTKRSKKDFHISHASGSGDGTDFELGVPDEQQRKISGTDEGTEDDDDDEDDTKDESDNDGNDDSEDSDGNDDDDDDDDDDDNGNDDDDSDHERTESDRDENPNLNQSNEEHEEEKEEYVDEFTNKEDDADNAKEETEEELDNVEELYRDVNVNLRKEDVEITDADQGGVDQHNVSQESGFEQEEVDAHMTLTTVHDIQKTDGPMQSSFVLSDFTEKLLKFENVSPAHNEIASLMNTTVNHEEPSGQTSSLYTFANDA
ncbi:hypothetical protein Tco_0858720 [Tanacetum coccineum]|uniref:Uncharacterized protein n=1 Tax=Tanacetum coccineum TaxID=301880 RepID=A0ABQ5BAY4_9ASTR